jgi:hypothetical protein
MSQGIVVKKVKIVEKMEFGQKQSNELLLMVVEKVKIVMKSGGKCRNE